MKYFVVNTVMAFLVFGSLKGSFSKLIEFQDFQDPEGPWRRQPILIQDGGYQNLLVAVHGEVKESIGLIEDIKNAFTKASQILYEATKQRVYFQDISILVPSQWSKNSSYESPRPNETYHTSRVILRDEESDAAPPAVPFVRQPGGCGEEGEYMYLPRRLFGSEHSIFGDPAKVIVHLWGHLRWGLFDEFPTTPTDQFFFQSNQGRVEPSFCPSELTGKVLQGNQEVANLSVCSGGENNVSCEFLLTVNDDGGLTRTPNGRGSLMSSYLQDSVTQFCHSEDEGDVNSRHNHEAPTQQNRLCLGMSSWDVIVESGDIMTSQTRRLNHAKPNFRIVQKVDQLLVVVLDARENMKENNKFQRMMEAYKHYLYDLFPPYSHLGVVSVNKTTEKVFPCLKLWETPGFRWFMNRDLPTAPVNHSSLGASIPKAIEILQERRDNISGSVILIMSDGTDDITPTIADVQDDITSAGVVVASLPFSANLSENIVLPNTVDVKYTEFLENGNTHQQYQGTRVTDWTRFIRIAKEEVYLDTDDEYRFHVTIDDALDGQELFLRFFWRNSKPEVCVTMEDGTTLANYFNDYIGRTTNYSEADPMQIDSQKIYVYLNSTEPSPQTITFEVSTGLSVRNDEALVAVRPVRASLMMYSSLVNVTKERMIRIYGTVSQVERPITACIVKADVINPEGGKTTLIFRDDGKGIDNHREDGIYSAYFTNFTSNGDYHVDMSVKIRKRGRWKRVDDLFTSGAMTPKLKYPIRYRYGGIPPFQRAPLPITFTAADVPKDFQTSDYLPPGIITDLRLVTTVLESMQTLTLAWTAPGDDFMEGQATGYELMFTSTRSAMRGDFGQVKKVTEDTLIYATLEKPKPAHNTELLIVTFASYLDSRTYLAIRAFDEYNNFGDISNILEVSLISGNTSVPVTPCRLQTTGQTEIKQGNLSKVVFSLIVLIGTLSATGIFVLVSVLVAKKVKSRQKVSGSIPLVLK